MHIRILNRSDYDTDDLRRLIVRGARACGLRRSFAVLFVRNPRDVPRGWCLPAGFTRELPSRACAEVGGRRMVFTLDPRRPSTLRRLGRLFEHEAYHLLGYEHEDMSEARLYSLGPTPAWARGLRVRRKRRRSPRLLR